jgi:twitching motility protein PilU
MAMDRLFQLMKDKAASDMFLAVNAPIQLKINGNMIPINQQKMDQKAILTLLAEVVSDTRLKELERNNELNIGIPVAGIGSFRLSAFTQRGSTSAVVRFIPGDIPLLEDLHVPPILSELIMEKRGLLLVVGATGSDIYLRLKTRSNSCSKTRNRSSTSAKSAATRPAWLLH